ncbi:MAG: MarR family transcriptional regulator [Actinobacteria bacterium]|nr:MarR family transcriptional regulator [Actinomycetota bacterium]
MSTEGTVAESSRSSAVVEAVLGASRVLVAVAARSLAEVGEDVTLPQYRALVVLASKGPQRVASLAEALGVTPPTATRMCDRLVRKGLLKRRISREDRREVRLTIAPAGQELVTEVTRRRRLEIARILSKISVEDQQAMAELFGKLTRAAGEVPDQDWAVGWEL